MAKVSNKNLLAIALVLSLITSILVYKYLKGVTQSVALPEGVSVVVANVDIGPKTKITAAMVSEIKVPPEYIQPGAVTSLDKVIGIVAKEQIIRGEQISERRLLMEGRSVGFTGIIPRDKRAVTVAVNDIIGVGGFIKAGDYIDVVATFDIATVGENVSRVVMQNILVLAVNHDTEISMADTPVKDNAKETKELSKSGTVTLAVSSDEAAKLALAEERGKLRLLLRPYLPLQELLLTEVITPKDLVGDHIVPVKNEQTAPPAPQPQQPPISRSVDREVPPITKPIIPAPSNSGGIKLIRGTKTENITLR